MIATLAVVVILGVLVTIVITSATPSTPSTHLNDGTSSTGTSAPVTTTTTAASSVSSDTKAAVVSACRGNYSIVLSAVSDYETLNGSDPPAGKAWATSAAGGPILQSWPSDPPYYSLEWNGHELSVDPQHGTASHGSTGTATPATGCYAA